jgi:hypothetical protein
MHDDLHVKPKRTTLVGSTSLHIAAPLDEHHDARFRELSTGAFIVGASSVGYGFYRWSRERWGTSRAAAAGLGAGVALTASAAFLLAVDEDDGPAHGLYANEGIQRHYWDTGLSGVITGGVGVVLLGLGWWGAARADSSAPLVQVGNGRTVVGWAGTF